VPQGQPIKFTTLRLMYSISIPRQCEIIATGTMRSKIQ
jgi:hypothetical protein